jgi:hypothetical protein
MESGGTLKKNFEGKGIEKPRPHSWSKNEVNPSNPLTKSSIGVLSPRYFSSENRPTDAARPSPFPATRYNTHGGSMHFDKMPTFAGDGDGI